MAVWYSRTLNLNKVILTRHELVYIMSTGVKGKLWSRVWISFLVYCISLIISSLLISTRYFKQHQGLDGWVRAKWKKTKESWCYCSNITFTTVVLVCHLYYFLYVLSSAYFHVCSVKLRLIEFLYYHLQPDGAGLEGQCTIHNVSMKNVTCLSWFCCQKTYFVWFIIHMVYFDCACTCRCVSTSRCVFLLKENHTIQQ